MALFSHVLQKTGSATPKPFTDWLRLIWQGLRHVSGDDAYERYLAHHRLHHADAAPLDRAAWFRHEQKRKWDGVRRCC